VPILNRLVFSTRFFYYVRIRNKLIAYVDDSSTYLPEYSKKMLLKGRTSNRPLSLIMPLASIPGIEEARVLSVGSRYETELLYLLGYGFKSDHIRGLDLFSYSPWIDAGNMHQMPYADSSFNVVILGWIISYSETPKKVAEEVCRVIKNGGYVAVGVSFYSSKFYQDRISDGNEVIGNYESRIQTTGQILDLFSPWVDKVLFSFDPKSGPHESRCVVVFSLKK
jgi:SAM-dependent methyltransferase